MSEEMKLAPQTFCGECGCYYGQDKCPWCANPEIAEGILKKLRCTTYSLGDIMSAQVEE
ncbi:MAG: hypothetical protein ACR2PR_09055 [Pseudohongiellaceae bacterium]